MKSENVIFQLEEIDDIINGLCRVTTYVAFRLEGAMPLTQEYDNILESLAVLSNTVLLLQGRIYHQTEPNPQDTPAGSMPIDLPHNNIQE